MRAIMQVLLVIALVSLPLSAAGGVGTVHQLRQALDRPIDEVRIDEPLAQGAVTLERLVGVPVRVDWAGLAPMGITPRTQLRVAARQVTARGVLDLSLMRLSPDRPLAWYVNDMSVVITTQQRAMSRLPAREVASASQARQAPTAAAPGAATGRPATASRPGLPLEYRFDNLELEKVLDFIRDVSGVNMAINWNSLEQSGISRQTPVSLNVRNVSIARVLDLVTDQVSTGLGRLERVYWVVDRGVLSVATGHALNTRTRTEVIDVSDLLITIPNRPMPELAGAGRGRDGDRSRGGQGRQQDLFANWGQAQGGRATTAGGDDARREMEQALIEIIRDSIGQDMWEPMGRGSVRILRGQLIITQTPLGFKLLQDAMGGR